VELSSFYTVTVGRVVVKYMPGRIQWKIIFRYFNIASENFPRGTKENRSKHCSGYLSFQAERNGN
jgi:hypothetical protein